MMNNQGYIWVSTVDPFVMLFASIIVLLLTFLPSFIAYSRNHPNRLAILILNFLLGWTGVGWIILLIWAFNSSVIIHRQVVNK